MLRSARRLAGRSSAESSGPTLARRYDGYTGFAIDPQQPMKDAPRAMMKGLQNIQGRITKARTVGLPGLATKPDTGAIGAIASHGGTISHRPQFFEISRRTHSAAPELTR